MGMLCGSDEMGIGVLEGWLGAEAPEANPRVSPETGSHWLRLQGGGGGGDGGHGPWGPAAQSAHVS